MFVGRYYTNFCNQEPINVKEDNMNKKLKYIIISIISIAFLIFLSIQFGPSNDLAGTKDNKPATQVKEISDEDVVGIWINHHNKQLHQKITFHKNHKWNEDQQGVKNIYSGTWKIIGKRTIRLAPYGEKIVFNKNNVKQINVVNYHHILTKN